MNSTKYYLPSVSGIVTDHTCDSYMGNKEFIENNNVCDGSIVWKGPSEYYQELPWINIVWK
jgi:hypothetical protein